MNDNWLPETPEWAVAFEGKSEQSLRAAVGVLSGLIDDPMIFLNVGYAVEKRLFALQESRTTVAQILSEVSASSNLSVAQIISYEKTRKYTIPRQEAMFRAYTECPHLSYQEIGRRLGGRDHTTVCWGVRAHCKRIGLAYRDAISIRIQASNIRGVTLNDGGRSMRMGLIQ